MKAIGIITATFAVLIISTLTYGYAFCKLWLWFIAGPFGIIPITLGQAVGIRFVIGFVTTNHTKKNKEEFTDLLARAAFTAIVYPALTLGIAAIINQIVNS